MRFIDELGTHHNSFTQYLKEHDSEDLFLLPYAEYSNQIYLQFHAFLRQGYLAPGSPLSLSMERIGIAEQDEQLIIFILTHYLALHANDVIQ